MLAEPRFALALALWPQQKNQNRAQQLASMAQRALKDGATGHALLAKIDRWLAR